jgi:hypothetical protein
MSEAIHPFSLHAFMACTKTTAIVFVVDDDDDDDDDDVTQ